MEHLHHPQSIVTLNQVIKWNLQEEETQTPTQQSHAPYYPIHSKSHCTDDVSEATTNTTNPNNFRIFFDSVHEELILLSGNIPTEVFVSSKFHNCWIRFPLQMHIPSSLTRTAKLDQQIPNPSKPLNLPITNASISPYWNYLSILLNDNDVHVYSLKTGAFIQHCHSQLSNVSILSTIWMNPATIPTSKREPLLFMPPVAYLHDTKRTTTTTSEASKPDNPPSSSSSSANSLTPSTIYQHALKSPFDTSEFNSNMGKKQVQHLDFNAILNDVFGSDNTTPLSQQKKNYYDQYILPYLKSRITFTNTKSSTPSSPEKNDKNDNTVSFANTLDLIISPLSFADRTTNAPPVSQITSREQLHWASATTIQQNLHENHNLSSHEFEIKPPTLFDLHQLRHHPASMSLISPPDQVDIPPTVSQQPHDEPSISLVARNSSSINKSSPPNNSSQAAATTTTTKPREAHSITEYIIFITNIGIEAQAVSPKALTRQQTIAFSIEDFWFEPRGNFLLCATPSKVLHLIQASYNLPNHLNSIFYANNLDNLTVNNHTNNPHHKNPLSPSTSSPIELMRITKFEIDESNQRNTPTPPSSSPPSTHSNNNNTKTDVSNLPHNNQQPQLDDTQALQHGLPTSKIKPYLQQDCSNVVMISPSLHALQTQAKPSSVYENTLFLPSQSSLGVDNHNDPDDLTASFSGGLFGVNVSIINNQFSIPHSNTSIGSQNSNDPASTEINTTENFYTQKGTATTNPSAKSSSNQTSSTNGLVEPKSTSTSHSYRLSLLTLYNRLYISLHDEYSGALLLFTLGHGGVLTQTHTFQTQCRGRCVISVKHDLIQMIQINGDIISFEQYWWNLSLQAQMPKDEQKNVDMCYIASRCCLIDIKNTGATSMTHQWILLNAPQQDKIMHEMEHGSKQHPNNSSSPSKIPLIERQNYCQNRLMHLVSDYSPESTFVLTPTHHVHHLYNQNQCALQQTHHNPTSPSSSNQIPRYVFYPPCYLVTINSSSLQGSLSVITPNYYNLLKQANYIQYPSLMLLLSHRAPLICKYYHLLILRSMVIAEGFIKQAVLYQNLLQYQKVVNSHQIQNSENTESKKMRQIELLEKIPSNVTLSDLSSVQDLVHDVLDATYDKSPNEENKSEKGDYLPHTNKQSTSQGAAPKTGLFDYSSMCYCCYMAKHIHEYHNKTVPLPTLASADSLTQVQQQPPHTLTSFSWLLSRTFISLIRHSFEPVNQVTFYGDHTYINPHQFSPHYLKNCQNKLQHTGEQDLKSAHEKSIDTINVNFDSKQDSLPIQTKHTNHSNWEKSLPLSYFPLKHPLLHIITTEGYSLLTQSDILHFIYLPLYYHYMSCPHLNLCTTCHVKKNPLRYGAQNTPQPDLNSSIPSNICMECLVKQQIRSIHLHFLTNLLTESIRSAYRHKQQIQQQYYILLLLLLIKQQQFQLLHQSLLYGIIDDSLDVIIKLLLFFINIYQDHCQLESYSGQHPDLTQNAPNNSPNQATASPSADLLLILDEIESLQTKYQQQQQLNSTPSLENKNANQLQLVHLAKERRHKELLLRSLLHETNLMNIHPFYNLMNVQGLIYEINYITHPKPHHPYIYTQYLQYVVPTLSVKQNSSTQQLTSTLPPQSGHADSLSLTKIYTNSSIKPHAFIRISPTELTDILEIEDRQQQQRQQPAPTHPPQSPTIPSNKSNNLNSIISQAPQYPSMNMLLFPFAQDVWFSFYAQQLRSLLNQKSTTLNMPTSASVNVNNTLSDLNTFLASTQDQYLALLQYRHFHSLHFYNTTYVPFTDLYQFIAQLQHLPQYLTPDPTQPNCIKKFQFQSFISIIDQVLTSSNHISLTSPLPQLEHTSLGSDNVINTSNTHYTQYPRQTSSIQGSLHWSNPLIQYIYDIFFRRNYGLQILQHLTHQYHHTTSALRLVSSKNKLLQTSIKYDMYSSVRLLGSDVYTYSAQRYVDGPTHRKK